MTVSVTLLAQDFFSGFLVPAGMSQRFRLRVLHEGRLCRLYRATDGERDWVIKWYGKDPSTALRRLKTERAFYTLAWERGLRQIPQPLAWDEERMAALLAFAPGRPLRAADMNLGLLAQVAAFLVALHRARSLAAGRGLPLAAGAVFSLERRLQAIGRLFIQLGRCQWPDDCRSLVKGFIVEELEPAWQMIHDLTLRRAAAMNWKASEVLPVNERCLSPARAFLHNARQQPDGKVVFGDFAGAGWDDPAHLVADCFVDATVPVSLALWSAFSANLARGMGLEERTVARSRILLPLGRVDWLARRLLRVNQAGKMNQTEISRARKSLRGVRELMELAPQKTD